MPNDFKILRALQYLFHNCTTIKHISPRKHSNRNCASYPWELWK